MRENQKRLLTIINEIEKYFSLVQPMEEAAIRTNGRPCKDWFHAYIYFHKKQIKSIRFGVLGIIICCKLYHNFQDWNFLADLFRELCTIYGVNFTNEQYQYATKPGILLKVLQLARKNLERNPNEETEDED